MIYGLNEETVEKIKEVFGRYPAIEQVIIYGSRAKGTAKKHSDIDLTLTGKQIDLTLLNKISWELDDLLLPYTFDLSIHHQLEQADLIDHIKRVGKVLYEGTEVDF